MKSPYRLKFTVLGFVVFLAIVWWGVAKRAPAGLQSPKPQLIRQPYLQLVTRGSARIVWRTQKKGTPGFRFGSSPKDMPSVLSPKDIDSRPVEKRTGRLFFREETTDGPGLAARGLPQRLEAG